MVHGEPQLHSQSIMISHHLIMENIDLLEQKYLDILRIKNNLINRIDQLEWYILRCGLELPASTDDVFVYASDSAHNRKRVRYSSASSNGERMIPITIAKRDSYEPDINNESLLNTTHKMSSHADNRNSREQSSAVPNLYNALPDTSDIQAQISAEVENRIAAELGNIQKTTKITIDEDLDIYKQQIHAQISDAIQKEMEEKFSDQLEEVRSHLRKEFHSLAVEQYSQHVLVPKESITSRADRLESNQKVTDFESPKRTSDELIDDSTVSGAPRLTRNQSKQEFDTRNIVNPLDVQQSKPDEKSKDAPYALNELGESMDVSALHEPSFSDNHISAAEPREQMQEKVSNSLDASRRSQDHDYELSTFSDNRSSHPREYNQRTGIGAYQSKKDDFTADKNLYHNRPAENKEADSGNVKKTHSIESYSTSTPRKTSSPAVSKIRNNGRYPHASLLSEADIDVARGSIQPEEKQHYYPSSPANISSREVPDMSSVLEKPQQPAATPPETQKLNSPPNKYPLDASTSLKKSLSDQDHSRDTRVGKIAFSSPSDSEHINSPARESNNTEGLVLVKPTKQLSTQVNSLADESLINEKRNSNSELKPAEPIPSVQIKLAPTGPAETSTNKNVSSTPQKSLSSFVDVKANTEGVASRDPRLPMLEKSERSSTGTPSRLFRLSAVSSNVSSEDRATKEKSKTTYSKRNFVPRYAFLRDGDTSNFLPESRRD